MALLLLLLCSAVLHLTSASHRLRFLHIYGTGANMIDAVRNCEGNNASLLTLYDDEDARVTARITHREMNVRYVWLGLRYSPITTWSNGEPVKFNKTTEELPKHQQRCEAITDNTWSSFDCSDEKYFMCSNGTDYSLVNIPKTWCKALQHCRDRGLDLVSIHGEEQNEEVIRKGENKSFWIGLMRDEWQWQDNGCATFRRWNNQQADVPPDEQHEKCTKTQLSHDNDNVNIYIIPCGDNQRSICTEGSVRIKVIEKNKTWEEAYDYCENRHSRLLTIEDDRDQLAVQQWLQYTDADGPFWIGLKQSRVCGFWTWTSGTTVDQSNWENDTMPELPTSNHCGVIHKDDYKWTDEDCLQPRPFLCEEDIIYLKEEHQR